MDHNNSRLILKSNGYDEDVTDLIIDDIESVFDACSERILDFHIWIGEKLYSIRPSLFNEFAFYHRPDLFESRKFFLESRKYKALMGLSIEYGDSYDVTELVLATLDDRGDDSDTLGSGFYTLIGNKFERDEKFAVNTTEYQEFIAEALSDRRKADVQKILKIGK